MVRTCFLLLFLLSFSLCGQKLNLCDSLTASELVDILVGDAGVRVGNVKLTGDSGSFGAFSIDTNVFGMKRGIVLCTGKIKEIPGPNTSGRKSSNFLTQNLRKLQSDRNIISLTRGRSAYDVVILEFDFVPFQNRLEFNYVFGSEEYTEFVDTPFNDGFGFFISGPGIKRRESNLAALPDKQRTPVTINSINHKRNQQYYINNNPFKDDLQKSVIGRGLLRIRKLVVFWHDEHEFSAMKKRSLNQALYRAVEFDGLTRKLTATSVVQPYRKYHLRIIICDVSDGAYDSGVFLEEGSFTTRRDTTVVNYKPVPGPDSKLNVDSILFSPPVIAGKKDTSKTTVTEIDDRFVITNVLFDFDKTIIPDTVKPMLDSLALYLVHHPALVCHLDGFTDSKGSRAYNQRLSEKRSAQVMDYLSSRGVARDRMHDAGFNYERPVAGNQTDTGRAMNRRVEIRLIESDTD